MVVILHQLGGLFIGSVPTMLLFLLLVALYRTLVYHPLTKVLSERRALTEGAIEAAAASIAAADAKGSGVRSQAKSCSQRRLRRPPAAVGAVESRAGERVG